MPTELCTLDPPATATIVGDLVTLETDLIVAGMIACHWAMSGNAFQPCKRGWGEGLRAIPIHVNGSRWTAGHESRSYKGDPHAAGILVVRHVDSQNGGRTQECYWFPMHAFKTAKITMEGIRVE